MAVRGLAASLGTSSGLVVRALGRRGVTSRLCTSEAGRGRWPKIDTAAVLSVDHEPDVEPVKCRSVDFQPERVGDLFLLTVQ
jgi:hypothetical protein